MNQSDTELLQAAREGDIQAFDSLFAPFKQQLRSYLYRLLTDKHECDDMLHDVYIKGFENLAGFRGEASLKNWIFTIATNHARRKAGIKARWQQHTHLLMREFAHARPDRMEELEHTAAHSPHGHFEVKEHIDFCFTCITKILSLEEQLVILLKHIYRFKIKEISPITGFSVSKVKHLLVSGKNNMLTIFDFSCALVSKKGYCNQCSELNNKFNPKQAARAEWMELEMVKKADTASREQLFDLRAELASRIDMLTSEGRDLHEVFFKLARQANLSEKK